MYKRTYLFILLCFVSFGNIASVDLRSEWGSGGEKLGNDSIVVGPVAKDKTDDGYVFMLVSATKTKNDTLYFSATEYYDISENNVFSELCLKHSDLENMSEIFLKVNKVDANFNVICSDDKNGMLRWMYLSASDATDKFLAESFTRNKTINIETPFQSVSVPGKGFINAAKTHLNLDVISLTKPAQDDLDKKPAKQDSKKTTESKKYTLACSFDDSTLPDVVYHIDESANTMNGKGVIITSDQIRSKNEDELKIIINRYTGQIHVSIRREEAQGQCKLVEKRAF